MALVRSLVVLLLLLVALTLGVLHPRTSLSAPASPPPIPDEAMRALREGRYLRASLVLRDYLGATRDSSAAALLLAAQAEAGWGDWERVQRLLSGRGWLDTVAAGQGWELLGRSQLELGLWRESQSSYAHFLAVSDSGADRAQGLAHARQASARVRAGQYQAAVASYHQAAAHLPQLADWFHLFAASAAASAGDTLAVSAELAQADSAVRADWGWRALVRARETALAPRAALVVADSVVRTHPAAGIRAEASLRAGQLRLQLRDSVGARNALRRTLADGPGTSYGLRAARILAALPQASPADQRLSADVRLRHGDLDGALAGYRVYSSRAAPPLAERVDILEATGRALFAAGRYAAAEDRLLATADSSAEPGRAARALYTAARAQYRDGRRPVAIGTLRRVIERYPTAQAAAEAAWLLADLAHDAGDLEEARAHYRAAAVLAPTSEPAGMARMRLGGMAFTERDYDAALRHYQAYLAAFPDGVRAQQARYWAALALLQQRRPQEARRYLRELRRGEPFSYYGVRAAERLDQGFWDLPMEPSPPHNAAHDGTVGRALDRLQLLRELGWDDAAAFELRHARRYFSRWDGAVYSLAEGLIDQGFTATGMSLARELYRREGAWNLRLLRILYPFPYQRVILAEAAEKKVDPFLAAGLIRQESSFDTHAISGAGAIGLMQVMPATGRALARQLGIRKFTPALLERPDVNVHIGMAFLADQLRSWNGRTVPVLAAYNAGPGRVQRWRALPEWGRDELFTERIPYQETRDYVKVVQRNAAMYRALYGNLATTERGE